MCSWSPIRPAESVLQWRFLVCDQANCSSQSTFSRFLHHCPTCAVQFVIIQIVMADMCAQQILRNPQASFPWGLGRRRHMWDGQVLQVFTFVAWWNLVRHFSCLHIIHPLIKQNSHESNLLTALKRWWIIFYWILQSADVPFISISSKILMGCKICFFA